MKNEAIELVEKILDKAEKFREFMDDILANYEYSYNQEMKNNFIEIKKEFTKLIEDELYLFKINHVEKNKDCELKIEQIQKIIQKLK